MKDKNKEEIIQHIADVSCFQIMNLVKNFPEKYARQETLEELIKELKNRV